MSARGTREEFAAVQNNGPDSWGATDLVGESHPRPQCPRPVSGRLASRIVWSPEFETKLLPYPGSSCRQRRLSDYRIKMRHRR
jgi:hypothetical protein